MFARGTTSLFAALDVATGKVIGNCQQQHRHQEFIKFLELIDAQVPETPGVAIHLVMDNYATHKTPQVLRSYARRPRFHVHFIPTSSSWLNQVERFFAEITKNAFVAAPSAASKRSARRSNNTSKITTKTPGRSPRPPTPT